MRPTHIFSLTSALTGAKTTDACLIFISHLFIHSAETASSSLDSVSPGSEGAGALQVSSLHFKSVLQADFSHIIHLESVVQPNSPSESLSEGSKGSSFRRKNQEGSGHQDSIQSIPSTPDRYSTALTYKCLRMGKRLVFFWLDSDTSEKNDLPCVFSTSSCPCVVMRLNHFL